VIPSQVSSGYHGKKKFKVTPGFWGKKKKAQLCVGISLFEMPTSCLYKVVSIYSAEFFYLIGNVSLGTNQCLVDIWIFQIFVSDIKLTSNRCHWE